MTIDTITTDIESIKKFIAGTDEQPKETESEAKPVGEAVESDVPDAG